MSFVFTVDVEDPRPPHSSYPPGFEAGTAKLLALLKRANRHGTFFVVGELAARAPDVVRRIAAAGHEIGLHSMTHTPLPLLGATAFRDETKRGKKLLEDLIDAPVIGYRAPVFSLTAATPWAPSILSELGFVYSSSVLPASNPLFGFPQAPRAPFRWPSGLIELPAPVARFGPLTVPFLGGVYWRYLPFGWVERTLTKQLRSLREPGGSEKDVTAGLWSYCHPYDVDVSQPFYVMRETAVWVSVLLYWRRQAAEGRMAALLERFPAAGPETMAALVAGGAFAQAQTFHFD